MRQLYGARRATLIDSLRDEFGERIELHGAAAGMHVTMTLPDSLDDQEIAAGAAQQHLCLWPLSPHYMGEKRRSGLVLGFGSTAAEQIPAAVKRLSSLIFG